MTQNASVRTKNWPVYDEILRSRHYQNPELLKVCKSYYSGTHKDLPGFDYLCFEKLLLTPEISDSFLENLKDDISQHKHETAGSIIGSMFLYQNQTAYGFGNNSLFQHQEKRIVDKLDYKGTDWVEYYQSWFDKNPSKGMEYYIKVPASFDIYMQSLTIPTNNYNALLAKRWVAKLMTTPSNVVLEKSNRSQEGYILGIEAICRYPERFDTRLVEAARIIQPAFHDNCTPENVRNYIHELIESQFDSYINAECAGGKIHACVRFDNACQLDAMKEVLNPRTRPLCGSEQLDGRVYRKLSPESETRLTEKILHPLLDVGTVMDDIVDVDKKTLLCTRYLGASRAMRFYGFEGLAYDATNFNARYIAKKTTSSELNVDRIKPFPSVAVIESISGGIYVKPLTGGLPINVESKPRLAKFASRYSTPQELAIELSHPDNRRYIN